MRFARARPFSVGSCLTYRLPPTSARVCTRPRLTWPKDSRCHDTSSPTATFSSRASSAHGGLFHFELMSHVGGAPLRRVVVVTSINRLVTARPYSAPHVEAPDPDIIMRRSATSERTMTPATTSTRWRWKPPVTSGQITVWLAIASQPALAPSPQPRPAPTGQALPRVGSKEVRKWLDNEPQLKGRLTNALIAKSASESRALCPGVGFCIVRSTKELFYSDVSSRD
jgi:hypothetical protein